MPRSSSKAFGSDTKGLFTLIVLAIVVALGAFFSSTGSDPAGILVEEPTEQIAENPSVEIPMITPDSSQPQEAPTARPLPPSDQTSGDWWQVYFIRNLRLTEKEEMMYRAAIPLDQYNGSTAQALIDLINNARSSIHIASFEFDLTDAASALAAAKQRGVDVRWITDDEHGLEADEEEGHGQFKLLADAGIEIKDDGRSALMHNKFWIFDNAIVWTGSTNVTVSGMFEQDNNAIMIQSPELAAIYERQWQDMWAGQFGPKSPSTIADQRLKIKSTDVQVLFSPEDNAIAQIIPYIQNAQSSIYFMAFTYTHDDLGAAMIERFKSGVDVRGVFETTGSDSEFGQMRPLYCAGVPVKPDGNPAFLHHKVIIIDKKIVITGSLNFTNNADQSNNENVIILQNGDIARKYIAEFERIWGLGRDPDPAKLKCP
jgi:phosphatidylserine/phosphatidylglycerophosphate/cardiolipin synthase-like enzyme